MCNKQKFHIIHCLYTCIVLLHLYEYIVNTHMHSKIQYSYSMVHMYASFCKKDGKRMVDMYN